MADTCYQYVFINQLNIYRSPRNASTNRLVKINMALNMREKAKKSRRGEK